MVYPVKLGKLPKKEDPRNIKFSTILRADKLPPIPEEYNVDTSLPKPLLDNFMFANNSKGDCVIACRAHHTLRMEMFEQGQQIAISDNDVLYQYFYETGGADSGLVILESLKAWRRGWWIGDNIYKADAFAQVALANRDEVKAAIYLLNGLSIGFYVSNQAMEDYSAGKRVWDVVANDKGILGGHGVYVKAYNSIGPIVVTWGIEMQMTWAFWDKYTEEAYVVIDAKNEWMPDSPLDIAKLEQFLIDVTGKQPQVGPEPGEAPPKPNYPPLPEKPLAIVTQSLPSAEINQSYYAPIVIEGGTVPYNVQWAGGVIPAGIELLAIPPAISGKPQMTGSYPITVMVQDFDGSRAFANYVLSIYNQGSNNRPCSLFIPAAKIARKLKVWKPKKVQ